ncbi:hypothetical protein MYX76_18790, partial [Desulfobacterota bacterium AH_259_B03_O07]|nr:hypothetical protein [Desulfobacterota bacterium AH_259_B03_O07]
PANASTRPNPDTLINDNKIAIAMNFFILHPLLYFSSQPPLFFLSHFMHKPFISTFTFYIADRYSDR